MKLNGSPTTTELKRPHPSDTERSDQITGEEQGEAAGVCSGGKQSGTGLAEKLNASRANGKEKRAGSGSRAPGQALFDSQKDPCSSRTPG